jgi:hypothetical protein
MNNHMMPNVAQLPTKRSTTLPQSNLASRDQIVSAAERDDTFAKMIAIYWKDFYTNEQELIQDAISYYKANPGKILAHVC